MKHVLVRRESGETLCNAEVADGVILRVRGLLGRKGLAPDAGLLISPCSSVHTFFMGFPIVVVYLSEENAILRITKMKPYQISFGGRGAKKVLELAEGRADSLEWAIGEQLSLVAGATDDAH